MKYEAVKRGLRVAQIPGGWAVLHAGSNLPAVQHLRQRRFAEEARDELLATGVDFTLADTELRKDGTVQRWEPVYRLWLGRAHDETPGGRGIDPGTFEHYQESTSYGQFIPSAAQAAEMRGLAVRLRKASRTPVSELALTPYVNEFARMGLVMRDDTEILWTGAAV